MKTLRFAFGMLLCTSLIAGPAFAEEDAGALPSDATSTADTTGGDTGGGDAVDPPADTTGTTGGYTVNECWDTKCGKEIDACKASKGCDDLAKCVKGGKELNTCATDLKTTQADGDIFSAIQTCGWKSCNDPNAGSCKDPGKNGAANRCGQFDNNWKCNCDDACSQFGDCCADKDAVCGGGTTTPADSCKDKCDADLGQNAPCYCDSQCEEFGDCCDDYADMCGGGSTCTPACDGKSCGPDGCGGKCGTCPDGASCTASTGKCETAAPTEDTASSDDSSTGGTTDATTDGTGGATDTNTGTVPTSNTAAASSSGCTAAPVSQNATGIFFVLSMLIGLVVLRRREA